MSRIQDSPDDVVIQICQHLSVRDILAFRQVSNGDPQSGQSQRELIVPKTCKHAFAVSCLKTLWICLCTAHITARGIPFPDEDRVNQMSTSELETATREALDRDHRLRYESQRDGYTPKASVDWEANPSSDISEVLFVPDPSGREGRCIVTVSKGIWCLISLWDIQDIGRECQATRPIPEKIGSWNPKGAIFTAIALNSDCSSEASAAVGVNQCG